MAYNGASDEVAKAMAEVLDLEGMSMEEVNAMMRDLLTSLQGVDEKVQLEIANSIWSDDTVEFNQDFRQRCIANYDAEVSSVDFEDPAAAEIINGWVNDKTHGRIQDIATGFDLEQLVAMLINAIYLKGAWTYQFDPRQTTNVDFHLADGGTKQVPIMHQEGDYSYYENEDFQAVSLPYGGGRLSMYVFLPREGNSLDSFVSNLNRKNWDQWMAAFASREGAIGLPRFKVDYTKDLSTSLSSLGMDSAFIGDAFPNMASVQPLWIDRVVQKTYIDVYEEGTEAAAATGIGMTMGIDSEQPFFMEVDRPFFFAIRDNQKGTLLFMGSIFEP
jgi:serpin B